MCYEEVMDMKKSKKLASLIMVVLCFVLLFSSPSVVFAATVDMNCDETLLVSKYINAINNGKWLLLI